MAVALFGVWCALILVSFGQNPLCHFIGFFYPMYASFKAVESPDPTDDTQWLTYWIIYGGFTVAESFTDALFNVIPFYYFVKIGFLVWCFLPQTLGAKVLYLGIVRPVLRRYETRIDRKLVEVVKASDFFGYNVKTPQEQQQLQRVVTDVSYSKQIVHDSDSSLPVSGDLSVDGSYQFIIHAFRANNLAARDRGGTSDPYFVLYWEGDVDEDLQYKSVVKKESLNPEWNAIIPFPWKSPQKKVLYVDVWDKDMVGQNDFLGRAMINVRDMTNLQTSFPLKYREGTTDEKTYKIPDNCTITMSFVTTKLEVSLTSGKDLRKADTLGKSDPYCFLYWQGDDEKERQKSQAKDKTLNPEWREQFYFDWGPPFKTNFVVDVWDLDKGSISDDFLGRTVIPTSKMASSPMAFPLAPRDDQPDDFKLRISGTVTLSFKRLRLPM